MNSRGPFLSQPRRVVTASLAAIALFVVLLWSPWDRPRRGIVSSLRVFCAAGMVTPVREILTGYEAEYGVKTEENYDGSGKLLSTIRTIGVDGDLYVSADAFHIEAAKKEGLVAEVIPLAVLRPVVVVNTKTKQLLDAAGTKIVSLRDLLQSDLKFVLAHPDLASVGQLTKAVVQKASLWSVVEERLRSQSALALTVNTVNEVTVTVRTREGYAGVVWSANAAAFSDLHVLPLPEFAGVKELLQVGVLAKSKEPTAALRLARYLAAADKGAKVLAKYHYEAVGDADVWEETPTIHLSAGAMLLPGIDVVVKAFAEREGVDIKTSYGGCGLLVSQMKAIKSSPASKQFPDAYFACDQSFLDDVADWFQAGVIVARNPMVLVVAKGNPVGVRDLGDLTRKDLRVGLAHAENSALGKLTERLLKKLNLHERVYSAERRQPIVHADAAHSLVNQMRVGALDVAVVYKSNVLSASATKENLDLIDLNLPEAVATQPFAIAQNSRHKHLMRRLLEAIVAPDNAARFQSLGFSWMYEAK